MARQKCTGLFYDMAGLSHNIPEIRSYLKGIAKTQVPFATALALNDTIADVAEIEGRELESSLDAPTPFTRKGFYQGRANKRRLTAKLGIKRIQAEYLQFAIDGGLRKPKRRAILVPGKIRLNKFGNMPKGSLKRATAKSDTFVVNKGDGQSLRPGIYRRPKVSKSKRARSKKLTASPVLLAAFADKASYRKRYAFHEVGFKAVKLVYRKHFERRLTEAIRSKK
jgi:hypothetical protein